MKTSFLKRSSLDKITSSEVKFLIIQKAFLILIKPFFESNFYLSSLHEDVWF